MRLLATSTHFREEISLLRTTEKLAFFAKTLEREQVMIKDASSIKPGDHLEIKRSIFYKEIYHHHFLCTNDSPMTIIHYYKTPPEELKAATMDLNFKVGKIGTVQEVPIQELIGNEMDLQKKGSEVAKILWPLEIRFSPEEVIERARSRLGEAEYSLLTNNCESFAMWSVCGLNFSPQSAALWPWLYDKMATLHGPSCKEGTRRGGV